MLEESKKIILGKESCEKKAWVCSVVFILCFMIYVLIVSLLINLVLEPYIEPMYLAFQALNVLDLEFWMFTGIISIIYMILNFTVTYISYRITFSRWTISLENKKIFLRNIMILFPITLFLVSFFTEGEWYPIIINILLQMLCAYLWRDMIKISETQKDFE